MNLTQSQVFEKALDAYKRGSFTEAKELLSSVLAFSPASPKAHYQMALIEKELSHPEQSAAYFKKSLQADPRNIDVWLAYIDTLITLNRFDFARSTVNQLRNKGAKGLKLDLVENKINQLINEYTPSIARAITANRTSNSWEPSDIEFQTLNNLLAKKQFGEVLDYASPLLDKYANSVRLRSFCVVANLSLGDYREAIRNCEKIREIYPSFAQNYLNMGFAYYSLGELKIALGNYHQAIKIEPDYLEAHYNLGIVWLELGQLDSALDSFNKVIDIKPEFLEAYNNIAIAYQRIGDLNGAIINFKKALEYNSNYTNSIAGLGKIYTQIGQHQKALIQFKKCHAIIRGENLGIFRHKSYDAISKAKIEHDIEQFEYLSKSGYQRDRFDNLAALYRLVSAEIQWPSEIALVKLSARHKDILRDTYNRPIHAIEALRLPGSSIQDSINPSRVTEDYFANGQGLIYIDNFLTPLALESLRKFLLCSTIWFDFFHDGGYLGAYLDDGLACPLLLQIADELKKKFPKIFKNHALNQLWAYKYASKAYKNSSLLRGIAAHADSAAINVNFWITPKEANLDENSGGLVVYNTATPLHWGFKKFNNNKEELKKHVEISQAEKTSIPYKENRAVLFNSNLVHETDKFDFKEGYENRRINVTMLFGDRQ
ncbi:MAG: tetratricopeptide repeat protein [Gammaproteobacteria bacterium]|nr:tetratricopeptide repeat protein [Gammaproteobacteria bacterium]